LRQIWPHRRRKRRSGRSGESPILGSRQAGAPRTTPMKADRPNSNLELNQAEPFRVAFALFALVLGALAALQL